MPTFKRRERFSDPHFQVMRGGQPIAPPAQFAVGDILLGDRPLYDPATGTQDATLSFRGTIIRRFPNGDVLFGVNGEHKFNNGVIAIQDSFRFSTNQSTGAIVGGTGTFDKARGTVMRQILDPNTVEFTYDYTP
jgi:hypothetical protein